MKKVIYIIIGLLVLYFILCLIGPKGAKVERSVSLSASADLLKSKLVDLHYFHEKWSPWTEKDPNMKVNYTGEVGQPGSGMSWESEVSNVGHGAMSFLGVNGDSLLYKLSFGKKGDSRIYYLVKSNGTGCQMTWGMMMDFNFIGRGMMLFFAGSMDKMLGAEFDKGLAKLKVAIEAESSLPQSAMGDEIKELQWEERTYVGKRQVVEIGKLSQFYGDNFSKIYADINKVKQQPLSGPSCIGWSWDAVNKKADIAAAVMIAKDGEMKGWEKFKVPAAKVLMLAYYGDYAKLGVAHEKLNNYRKMKGDSLNFTIEEFITDPMTEKDTTKWLTNVYYILK
jgi:effector-binding domain-containing protein